MTAHLDDAAHVQDALRRLHAAHEALRWLDRVRLGVCSGGIDEAGNAKTLFVAIVVARLHAAGDDATPVAIADDLGWYGTTGPTSANLALQRLRDVELLDAAGRIILTPRKGE